MKYEGVAGDNFIDFLTNTRRNRYKFTTPGSVEEMKDFDSQRAQELVREMNYVHDESPEWDIYVNKSILPWKPTVYASTAEYTTEGLDEDQDSFESESDSDIRLAGSAAGDSGTMEFLGQVTFESDEHIDMLLTE